MSYEETGKCADQTLIINAVYRHHKGGLYTVTQCVTNAHTGDRMVIYHNTSKEFFARNLEDFLKIIVRDGERVARFTLETPPSYPPSMIRTRQPEDAQGDEFEPI